MGKDKQAAEEAAEVPEGDLTYEEKLKYVSVIAKPMASKKTAQRVYRLIRKSSLYKAEFPHLKCFWLGLKNVQTQIRKGDKGIVVIAGDVSPINVFCHLPGVCEEKSLPYIYVPSRRDIGQAMGKSGGSLTVLILPHESYKEYYDKVLKDINKAMSVFMLSL
ncbi:snoRNA-binding protein [Halocaridina rubra]|uniref:SnoRNA-binding protein n=1 Tax=Halocaridina rubra TaxID=373956 RepID=A0AAN8X579_HALRR